MTRIKICGLTFLYDIETVNIVKPDYIGFVFAKSRRQISAAQAAVLRERLSPDIIPVGVFVNETHEYITELAKNGIIDAVQLHGGEDEAYITRIKDMTGLPVIKAIPVTSTDDVQKWLHSGADYLLLDNKTGGSGKSFDHSLIGDIDRPFFLAGGLDADNVMAAIHRTNPFAVDISSGVETDGRKDAEKIKSIVRRIRNE